MPRERRKFLSPIILLVLVLTTTTTTAANDAAVLVQLAKSVIPVPHGWVGPDICQWQGISCDTSNRVTSINLSSRSLYGAIPPSLNQLTALKSLSLQRNRFSGQAPPLADMASLEEVYLNENNFDSIPPNFLSGLTRLQSFNIENNTNLSPWTIPQTLRDSSSLTSFIASKSNVVGQIPDIFGSLPNFHTLRLANNNMTGPLPHSFAKSGIQSLVLNNQMTGFTGSLYVLGSMPQLAVASLQSNHYSGPIPDLSACTELTDLQLRDNFLTGVIPDSLTRLPKLQTVFLQNNKFQGPRPSFPVSTNMNLGTTNNFCLPTPGPCDPQVAALLKVAGAMNYPSALADSWEGNNPCLKWIFITCEKGSVVIVNFGRQNWTGMISPAFANLTNLKSLFLNDNNLFGTIPPSLTGLRQLQNLDISNNNISGKIPPFRPSVAVKVSGNSNIGKHVPVTAPPGFPPNIVSSSNGSTSSKVWVIVISVIIILTVVFSVMGFIIYRRRATKKNRFIWGSKKSGRKSEKSRRRSGKQISSNMDQEKDVQKSSNFKSTSNSSTVKFSDYHIHDMGTITIPIEILREATDDFKESNILGKGGFGTVYKGKLHDGSIIAVKRSQSSLISDKGLYEFKAEIEVLKKVRHRHLVALHGFCDNGNERLLVYEYMPQGCLGSHLFHWKDSGESPLTWNQRVTIALDVARGIEYLHSLAQQSFIHRDLKPSNILLSEDMRAKVSDFGLVRSAPDGNYSIETRLAGTFGYLAPEYAARGRVTTKVDVYAFGVVLMEIITGRKALDDSLPDEQSHLVTWFRRQIPDKEAVRSALDPVLLSHLDEEKFQTILRVAELAGHCTTRDSYQRPDMSHAVNVLSPLVEHWKPAEEEDEEDILGHDSHMSLPQVLQKWKASQDSSSSTMSSSFFDSNTVIDNYGPNSSNSGMR